MVQIYLCGWHIFHLCLFGQKAAFSSGLMNFVMLKFFRAENGPWQENRHFPKTVRFRGSPAQQGGFMGRHPISDGFI